MTFLLLFYDIWVMISCSDMRSKNLFNTYVDNALLLQTRDFQGSRLFYT